MSFQPIEQRNCPVREIFRYMCVPPRCEYSLHSDGLEGHEPTNYGLAGFAAVGNGRLLLFENFPQASLFLDGLRLYGILDSSFSPTGYSIRQIDGSVAVLIWQFEPDAFGLSIARWTSSPAQYRSHEIGTYRRPHEHG